MNLLTSALIAGIAIMILFALYMILLELRRVFAMQFTNEYIKFGWILIIVIFPVAGFILFWALGRFFIVPETDIPEDQFLSQTTR